VQTQPGSLQRPPLPRLQLYLKGYASKAREGKERGTKWERRDEKRLRKGRVKGRKMEVEFPHLFNPTISAVST